MKTAYVIIQYNAIKYNAMQYNTIQYNTTQYNTMQYNIIPYDTIQYQYNTIQYNTIQYNTIQYNTIQYNKIRCGHCSVISCTGPAHGKDRLSSQTRHEPHCSIAQELRRRVRNAERIAVYLTPETSPSTRSQSSIRLSVLVPPWRVLRLGAVCVPTCVSLFESDELIQLLPSHCPNQMCSRNELFSRTYSLHCSTTMVEGKFLRT